MNKNDAGSGYWLDRVVAEIQDRFPSGAFVVSTGHSPSGRYHIGLFREFMTANAVTESLKAAGRDAEHVDFVDDFDALRKIPVGVDESYQRFLGQPLYAVPSPDSSGRSYADFYFGELSEGISEAGIAPRTVRTHEEYRAGKFTEAIERSLEMLAAVKEIIERVSGRRLDKGWVPVQILSDGNSLREWTFTGWDKTKGVVYYRDKAGQEGEVSYRNGRVKLDWRLDWPARWWLYGVRVEPFGRDHASSGGSYDTGKVLVKEVFGAEAPYPVPYEFINLVGQTKKMSKSAGNVITPKDALSVMPAEILRYFVIKSRPNKILAFDPGEGLYQLINEYSEIKAAVEGGHEHQFEHAYRLAKHVPGKGDEETISSVPFGHLVSIYQAALGKRDQILAILKRTGYADAVAKEETVIERELGYVKNWLEQYAPDKVKFSLQESLPDVSLSDRQTELLASIADAIKQTPGQPDGQWYHDTIHRLREKLELSPAEAFRAIYQVLLGKDHGPKAGWFLSILERDWLAKRFRLEA